MRRAWASALASARACSSSAAAFECRVDAAGLLFVFGVRLRLRVRLERDVDAAGLRFGLGFRLGQGARPSPSPLLPRAISASTAATASARVDAARGALRTTPAARRSFGPFRRIDRGFGSRVDNVVRERLGRDGCARRDGCCEVEDFLLRLRDVDRFPLDDHRDAWRAAVARGLHREPAFADRLLHLGCGLRERLAAQGREVDDAVDDRRDRCRLRQCLGDERLRRRDGDGFDHDRFGRFDHDRFGDFDGDRFGDFDGDRFGDFDGDGFGRFDGDGFGRFDGDGFGRFDDDRLGRDVGGRRHVRRGRVLRGGVDRRGRLERGGERGLDPDRGPLGVTALLAGGPALRLGDGFEDRLDDRRGLRQELGFVDEYRRGEQLRLVEERLLGADFGLLDDGRDVGCDRYDLRFLDDGWRDDFGFFDDGGGRVGFFDDFDRCDLRFVDDGKRDELGFFDDFGFVDDGWRDDFGCFDDRRRDDFRFGDHGRRAVDAVAMRAVAVAVHTVAVGAVAVDRLAVDRRDEHRRLEPHFGLGGDG